MFNYSDKNVNGKRNDLYAMLLKFNDELKSQQIFETLYPYMVDVFGENGITAKNLCLIQPKVLVKELNKKALLYEIVVQTILQFKLTCEDTNYGFNIIAYQKALDTYLAYDCNRKHYNKLKQKENSIVCEEFSMIELPTPEMVLQQYQKKYKIEIIEKGKNDTQFMHSYYNERNGKLVALIPFRNLTIKDLSVYWLCKCDCGGYVILRADRFKKTTCCRGCREDNLDNINYIGTRNNSLEVIDQRCVINMSGARTLELKVKCDCGSIKIMTVNKFFNSKYCGRQCNILAEMYSNLQVGENNSLHKLFKNGTNISKLGRTSTNRNNTTGYLGVSYIKSMDKYLSYITFQGKTENLGLYSLPVEAAKVRLKAQDILQRDFVADLIKDEFILNNKYLVKLLSKVMNKIDTNHKILQEL